MKNLIWIALLIIAFASCKKETKTPSPVTPTQAVKQPVDQWWSRPAYGNFRTAYNNIPGNGC